MPGLQDEGNRPPLHRPDHEESRVTTPNAASIHTTHVGLILFSALFPFSSAFFATRFSALTTVVCLHLLAVRVFLVHCNFLLIYRSWSSITSTNSARPIPSQATHSVAQSRDAVDTGHPAPSIVRTLRIRLATAKTREHHIGRRLLHIITTIECERSSHHAKQLQSAEHNIHHQSDQPR